jgi:hypothetical protein
MPPRLLIVRRSLLLAAALWAVIAAVSQGSMPALAAIRAYQGSVTINGAVAANGTEVRVTVDGKDGVCASTVTAGGRYLLYVADSGGSCPDPQSTPTVTFLVNNIAVGAIAYEPSDGVQPVDLVVNQAGEAISGRAMVEGTPAASGTIVAVTVVGNTTPCITALVGGLGEYQVVVPPATEQTPNCPSPGQQITFTLNGLATRERIPFEPARSVTLDLNAQPASHTVSGVALVAGQLATSVPVQAFVGQTLCGSTESSDQGRFSLTITAAVQQTGCGMDGSLVIFNIGGQRASQSVSFESGGNTQGLILSAAPLTCVYSDRSPPEGAVTSETTPRISINVTCVSPPGAISMSLDTAPVTPVVSGSGNTRTITYAVPAPLSPGEHVVTVSVAAAEAATWTFSVGQTVSVGEWVDRPPSTQGSARTCPPPGEWRLLYWKGPGDVPIETAALSCVEAEVFWLSRQGRWFGYSKGAPNASDRWTTTVGEATFIRGPD